MSSLHLSQINHVIKTFHMLHGKYQDVDEVLVDGIFEENVLYNQFRNNQKQL
jgi:hypothetical protein